MLFMYIVKTNIDDVYELPTILNIRGKRKRERTEQTKMNSNQIDSR
jgi:hypothetical protein